MKKLISIISILALFVTLSSFFLNDMSDQEVQFPEGYRSWTHVKSVVVTPAHPNYSIAGGYHHIYANPQAMTGYESGKFPQGAVIVADFIEMIENDNRIVEGKRRYIDVMHKDTVLYKSTVGWGFEEFEGSSKTIRRITQLHAGTRCYSCHTQKKENDFVFSQYRE